MYSAGAAGGLASLTSIETLTVYDQMPLALIPLIRQCNYCKFVRGDGLVTYTVPVGVTTVGLTNIVSLVQVMHRLIQLSLLLRLPLP